MVLIRRIPFSKGLLCFALRFYVSVSTQANATKFFWEFENLEKFNFNKILSHNIILLVISILKYK